MSDRRRFEFALAHRADDSVAFVRREDWEAWVCESGEVTFIDVPPPLARVQEESIVVAATASGIANNTPGIDIARYDENDAPKVYNVNRYTVLEDLRSTALYAQALKTAGIAPAPELEEFCDNHVFIVGPEEPAYHWSAKLPRHMASARRK